MTDTNEPGTTPRKRRRRRRRRGSRDQTTTQKEGATTQAPRGRRPPDILYHGTCVRLVDQVREQGTLQIRGNRPVYLSDHERRAWQVAHRRQGQPEVLYIDTNRCIHAGCHFERTPQGLWQARRIPISGILNLQTGFAHQVSAGAIPVWYGPDGPELAMISVRRRHGCTWEVAKGKLELGETPFAAAKRETREEMGYPLDLRPLQSLGFVRYGFRTPEREPRLKTMHMFLMRTSERVDSFQPRSAESVKDVAWFTPEAAARAVAHRSLRPLMHRVKRLLTDGPLAHPPEGDVEGAD